MEIENQIDINDFLKRCINERIKGIYVTGWTEVKNNINFFERMDFFYYLEFEKFFICIELDEIKHGLRFYIHKEIKCNFQEIFEGGEVFTVTNADERDFNGLEIKSFDIFYSKSDKFPWALGIKFKDTKSIRNRYAFFDGLSFDGIIFGDEKDKDFHYSKDERFALKKFPSE